MTLHNGWHMSTEHPASSYGIPVLVSPDGGAYGEGDMLTTTQVAELYGVSTRRVQAMIAAGRLTALKLGRDWLVPVPSALAETDRKPGRPPRG